MMFKLVQRHLTRHRTRIPLLAQAAWRQSLAMVLSIAITFAALLALYAEITHRADRRENEALATFYRARVRSLDRQLQESALRYKGSLEFTRILENPRTFSERLASYITVRSVGETFPRLLILDGKGEALFRWRDEGETLPGANPAEWYYSPRLNVLFRVLSQPIWLGPRGMGKLVLFAPIDNGVLFSNSFPGTALALSWQGKLVAKSDSSLKLSGQEQVLPWSETSFSESDTPLLHVRHHAPSLISKGLIAALGMIVLGALMGFLWLSIGSWLMEISRRIARLSEFSRHFRENPKLTPELRDLLEDASQDGLDEISEVARSLENLASTVEKRDHTARRAISLRDEFISIASHELKTPITSLSTQIQLLRRIQSNGRLATYPEEKLDRLTTSSHQQIIRLTRLIDDLLCVSKIESGKLELELRRMDLIELVRDTTARFRHDLEKAGCQLIWDLSEHGSFEGFWDGYRLEQVLINLLSNAMKFGPGKPIHLSIDSPDATTVRLIVRDEGIGISAADQKRIFRRYERAVSDYAYSGLGLGLYIVKRIVESHGGRIRVESTPGQGSTFIVELPLSYPETTGVQSNSWQLTNS